MTFSFVGIVKNYIRDTQFSPKEWATPGRVRETQCKLPPLQGKTIADVFEALIGKRVRVTKIVFLWPVFIRIS